METVRTHICVIIVQSSDGVRRCSLKFSLPQIHLQQCLNSPLHRRTAIMKDRTEATIIKVLIKYI